MRHPVSPMTAIRARCAGSKARGCPSIAALPVPAGMGASQTLSGKSAPFGPTRGGMGCDDPSRVIGGQASGTSVRATSAPSGPTCVQTGARRAATGVACGLACWASARAITDDRIRSVKRLTRAHRLVVARARLAPDCLAEPRVIVASSDLEWSLSPVRVRSVTGFLVEGDEPGAVRERICYLGGAVEGQPGCAHATGASEGDRADVSVQQEGSCGRCLT